MTRPRARIPHCKICRCGSDRQASSLVNQQLMSKGNEFELQRGPVSSQTDDPAPADPDRPVLLGVALSFVAGLPGRRRHGQAGHRHSLAPTRLSAVLEMEIQAATAR